MTRLFFLSVIVFMGFTASPALTTQSYASEPVLTTVSADVFQNRRNGRMWQMHKSKRLRSPEDVATYLNKLNTGKYQDWRLPTKQELYDLFSFFDLKLYGDVRIQLEGNYWLENDGMMAGAWEIGDQCGPSRSFYTKKSGYVRAIRP